METIVKYKVTIIKNKSGTALVEWDNGTLQRGYIPSNLIPDDYLVNENDLQLAVPYGVQWEDILTLDVTIRQLDFELKKLGIWTLEDVLANSDKVLNALKAVYGLELSKIQAIAKQQLTKEE